MAIQLKLPFEISKIDEISKFSKISKVSQGHKNFFPRVIFIGDFEYDLRIDKNFAI